MFIAIGCNRAFLPGLQTLLFSLRHHNPDHPPVVVISSDLESAPEGCVLHRVDPKDYAGCKCPQRWEASWHKLDAFRLGRPGPCILLGADNLVVGDVSELWRETPYLMRSTPGGNMDGRGINSDCIVLAESLLTEENWKRLVTFGRNGLSNNWADQGALDRLMVEDGIQVDWLPEKYNTMKRKYRHRALDPADDVRMIHYVGRKPWKTGNQPSGLEKSGGEEGYEQMEALWMEWYKRATA